MKRGELSFGLNLGDLLRGLGGLLDTVQKGDEQSSTIHKREQLGSNNSAKLKVACSYNVKIGELKDAFKNKRTLEPITNVFDEEDYIRVISELPDIEENQIQIQTGGSCLEFSAFGVQNYRATISLPCSVDEKTIIYQYKEGILEITIRKKHLLEGN
ncbi:MAG TPA: hypothetical protein VN456_13140 [Desulfosporosinus sp.]|nr:hypothetical protein [Desulfosporosinus sp.]